MGNSKHRKQHKAKALKRSNKIADAKKLQNHRMNKYVEQIIEMQKQARETRDTDEPEVVDLVEAEVIEETSTEINEEI